jgi:hypothetical protein
VWGEGYFEEGRRAHLKFQDICSSREETPRARRQIALHPTSSALQSFAPGPPDTPPRTPGHHCGSERKRREKGRSLSMRLCVCGGRNAGTAAPPTGPHQRRIRAQGRAGRAGILEGKV